MQSIIEKVKAALLIKRHKKKAVTEYTDLAPIDQIENGDEYLNALGWALDNEKIKNVALAGPYGSGKSSIIETYLKHHPAVKRKCLRISMATFNELIADEKGNQTKIDIGQDEVEFGILKQLFYKVNYKKIPQSRYRKLHKISFWRVWGGLIGVSVAISLLMFIFFPEALSTIIEKITVAGSRITFLSMLTLLDVSVISLILFGVLGLGILAAIASVYRSLLSHFRVKEIKLPIDATVKSENDSNETVFNKYLDEIFYFFEETKYRVVFFEDLDRIEESSVFVHLRELNTLLNNYSAIKRSIVFVYAVKDDIFSDADRTKFFEFIIPVVPIINSTNSGEILLEKLDTAKKIGVKHKISQGFVLDVSPYISDMRVLLNTYNEFIVYKKTLRVEQDLKLLDEPMMALMIFKNLYPRDFAAIQMESGVIKQAFEDKEKCLKSKKNSVQDTIDELSNMLDEIPVEALKSINELKSALLCEITDWRGIATELRPSGCAHSIRISQIINSNFDLTQWGNSNQCSGIYHTWDGSGGHQFTCTRFSEIYESYLQREEKIKLIEESRIEEVQKEIENLKFELHDISGWSLQRLIERFGSDEILSENVQRNKLLVFLLGRGYVDEKYANYINYFKGNTITKEDMNFILSVKNREAQPFNYNLTKTPMVVQRLQGFEFGQKEIYNFDLLECMLSDDGNAEKLNVLLKQLADEDKRSWEFIDEFIERTEHKSIFIKLLATIWPNMWECIAENPILTYERKIHYLSLLIASTPVETIAIMNGRNQMSGFIEQNEDILQQLASVESQNVIAVIRSIHVIFTNIAIEKVPDEILNYVFSNNCYELNALMIQRIVEWKNKDLVSDLESKNYTTILKLEYMPLVEYIQGNLTKYLENVVLVKEQVFDEQDCILDLLERSIDNQVLCAKIVEREDFCLTDITCCCGTLIDENPEAVRHLWNSLLTNNKVLPTWITLDGYWSAFKFTQDLLDFTESHIEDLVDDDPQCIDDDFIREFIGAVTTEETLSALLPCIRMDDFDIAFDSVNESKVSVMISCNYFEFSTTYYADIKSLFPHLCAEYILQNQSDYIEEMANIEMDTVLLENLLFSDKIETTVAQTLIDTYSNQFMTRRIAENLKELGLTLNRDLFKSAWEHLDESSKQSLMLDHLGLLDANTLHLCFTELNRWYSEFVDRSRQHSVELMDTPENRALAKRLEEVDYITSYQPKEKKEYDPVNEVEKTKATISYRIKAIK